jgi:hypothetical protein
MIIAIVSVLLISIAFSQYETFDLSAYQLTDYTKHSLRGNLSGNKQLNRLNDIADPTIGMIYNNRYSYFNGELNYIFQKGTRQYQRSLKMDLAFSTHLQNSENQNSTYYSSRVSPEFHIDNTFKRFSPGGLYTETDIVIDMDHTRSNVARQYLTYDHSSQSSLVSNNIEIYFPVKIGQGRIELINDATRALYIFQALDEAGRLSNPVDDNDIVDLANLITEIRNRSVFDTRLSNMKKLEDLDRFLTSRSMVDQPDSRYFVTLNDMWRNSSVADRYAGSQFAFVFRPGINIDYDKNLIEDEYVNERITVVDGGVEYKKKMPHSLKWQESIEACFYTALNNVYRFRTGNGSLYRNQLMNFNMSVERKYAYYPDTRTEMNITLGIAYANGIARLGENAEWLLADTQLLHGLVRANIYYYITPKLSLNANAYMEYLWAGESYSTAIPLGRAWRNYGASLGPNENGESRFTSNISFSIYYSIF